MRTLLVLALAVTLLSGCVGAYTSYIRAPAVLVDADNGILTYVSLNLTPGQGLVVVTGPDEVGSSTNESAIIAAGYASRYLGLNEKNYTFKYKIDNSTNISGPSAGLAFTLLAISALQHKPLAGNFTVTGTINPNGTVGEIGGVYDKVEAAKEQGMKFVLVPYAPAGSFEDEFYYIAEQYFNIPLVEVENVTQALPYAFGYKSASPLSFNLSVDYKTGQLPPASIACQSCNESYFAQLANFTINATYAEVGLLNNNFSAVKSQMLGQLSQYRQLESKNYLYSASDLSYLEYTNAYMLANSGNATSAHASMVMGDLNDYCESLTPPPLTSKNYEYVIGGEVRQTWGEINLGYAYQLLNESQTSDDVLSTLDVAASSAGWCNAASQMYKIATEVGGTQYVNTSAYVKSVADSYVNNPDLSQGNMYQEAALQDYQQGLYGAALYAGVYADVFDNNTSAFNSSSITAESVVKNLSGENYGVWPTQFARQAQFYLYEANMTKNSSARIGYVDSAYTTSKLAAGLNYANEQLANSFVNSTTPIYQQAPSGSNMQTQISAMQNEINQIYEILIALLVVVLVILIALIVYLVRKPVHAARGRRQRRAR